MANRHTFAEWIARQLRGAGSLASAALVVVGVLAFALYSLSAPSAHEQAPAARAHAGTAASGTVEQVVHRPVAPALYIRAASARPIVFTADIKTRGWKNRGQRVVDAEISRIERTAEPVTATSDAAVNPEGQITEQLAGQRVFASVSAAAAQTLPEQGVATVALVVTPMGETATLVIDEVIATGGVATARVAAASPNPSEITASTNAAMSPTATSPRVLSLSRYWGSAGTVVTMTGQHFGRVAGASWVTCGGAKGKLVSWSDTRIVFKVPSGMRKQGYIGIVKSKRPSNGLYYSPFNPPVITNITPREGAPGTTVTLKGRNFGKRQRDGWVTFAGSTAQVAWWSDTAISVIVPRDATSGYAGVVAHGMTSNGFLYGPLGAPLVTSVSARVLLPARTVTLRGRAFGTKRGTVVVGGVRIAPDHWSPTEVRFTVPRDLNGGYVGVVRGDSWTSNGVWVSWAPRLDSVSHWWTRPNGELTLTGIAFGATQGDRRVYIAGTEMTAASWSDSAITVRVPPNAPSGYVGVGTRSACSNGIWVQVETPAHITGVTPHNGVAAGDTLIVTGSGFGDRAATSRVLLGGTLECPVVSWSDTEIEVRAPLFTETTYLGVVKRGVSSNGIWLTPVAGR